MAGQTRRNSGQLPNDQVKAAMARMMVEFSDHSEPRSYMTARRTKTAARKTQPHHGAGTAPGEVFGAGVESCCQRIYTAIGMTKYPCCNLDLRSRRSSRHTSLADMPRRKPGLQLPAQRWVALTDADPKVFARYQSAVFLETDVIFDVLIFKLRITFRT